MQLVLVVSAVLLVAAGIVAYTIRRVRQKQECENLMSGDVFARFSMGEEFDLAKMLKLFHATIHLRRVDEDSIHYVVFLEKDRVKLVMEMEGPNELILEDIQRFYDANSQFTGWYSEYDHARDHTAIFHVTADTPDWEEAQKAGHLPSFRLSRRAIETILDELKRGAK